MALKQKLLTSQPEVKEVPDNVHDDEYYPESGTIFRFTEGPPDTFTLNKVSAPDDAKFPGEWDGAEFKYLGPGSNNDQVIDIHNYQHLERLYGIVALKGGEDFHVWFYIHQDGKVWCAARNTSFAAPKNGGWKFDPP